MNSIKPTPKGKQIVVQHVCKSVQLETSEKKISMFILLIDILVIFYIVIDRLIVDSCKGPKYVIDDIFVVSV